MAMVYSKREVKEQLKRLLSERDALTLSDWDREFLDDVALAVAQQKLENFVVTDKMGMQITRIYFNHW